MDSDLKIATPLVHKCIEAIAADVADQEHVRLERRLVFALGGLAIDMGRLIAIDGVAFASHANRKRVTCDDILLMTRRDPSLRRLLSEHVRTVIDPRKKPRKSSSSSSSSSVAPAHE